MSITVRVISADQHRAWIATRSSVSFLQLPEWADVKVGWRGESLGWFDGDQLIGAGLVLYRGIPKLPQRSLAYLPEGPDINWSSDKYRLSDLIDPLVAHCQRSGAFLIKMGPPVVTRTWDTDVVKEALAHAAPGLRLGEITASKHSRSGIKVGESLRSMGWVQEASDGAGFGDVQPRYVFQLSLKGRTLDDVFAGFNQLWRRNIRKAEKSGVVTSLGTRDDLAAFHEVYVETAQRDRFTPRGLAYFERMWDALNGHGEQRLTLHLAQLGDHLAAATLMVQVGDHAWYSYGASTTADREARPSNALQWHMINHAHAHGAAVYDMRGISDTLDPANHLLGLVQFKVGSGGFAQEYVGEWDLEVRKVWSRAYQWYQSRRG